MAYDILRLVIAAALTVAFIYIICTTKEDD